MYSNIKNVQYLIAMLKSNNVCHVVVSPGNSHNAIVRSIEEDGFFKTYSIVDERSAGFFACGLAQELKQPVAICCTAGTAASNYLTGVTEAFRRHLPLIVITGDKNPYYLGQYEDQMIDQVSIFKSVIKYGCILPIIFNEKDEWYCQRILNEAILELNHHGSGPVHIDVPIEQGMLAVDGDFTTSTLPVFKKIVRYDLTDNTVEWQQIFLRLKNKKVMVLCGQDDCIPEEEIRLIEQIVEKYDCVFAVDKISNLHCKGTVEITKGARRKIIKPQELMPDIVISIAGNPVSEFKVQLRYQGTNIEHWIVNEEGIIADPFKKLTTVFEGTTIQFLRRMAEYEVEITNAYRQIWENATKEFIMPEFKYSNLYAVQKLMAGIPAYSCLNLGNSTTIRIAQYFDLDSTIEVYCNRGVNGIDGCVSTFIGQAAASPNKLNFLIVGDLTFFYDMNAIWNRYVGKNVRIMLNNNEGAALFHFNQGIAKFPTINENVAAEHFAVAEGWAKSQGLEYLSARNKEEYDVALQRFLTEKFNSPVLFEVFTKKETDAQLQHELYKLNREEYNDPAHKMKHFAKKILGRQ